VASAVASSVAAEVAAGEAASGVMGWITQPLMNKASARLRSEAGSRRVVRNIIFSLSIQDWPERFRQLKNLILMIHWQG
jgi:hypothetical protein